MHIHVTICLVLDIDKVLDLYELQFFALKTIDMSILFGFQKLKFLGVDYNFL